ncbi:MAG TPA: LuxR C-terminal-related transcriptional regulator [Ferruginibacter sp.]|nr:LuxR C-terminal-related transcriptional regulator [Ferruginibacter sp.]
MRKTETPLTRREQEVLAALAKGFLYKEIALRLSISLDTVKKHCKNIYQKLNVRNRTEASNHFNSRKAA